MIVKAYEAGIYYANCYLIMDEESKEIAIIDPGGDGPMLSSRIDELKGAPKFILLTHGHVDHVGAVEYLSEKYKIPFYISKKDNGYIKKGDTIFGNLREPDGYISEGETFSIGSDKIEVLETPGHTEGGVSFVLNDMVFTGDTLFRGSIGRTDFPGGSLQEIIKSIKSKLMPLDGNMIVYPGHGPASTIIFEKNNNPYLI